ncbi:hypothetical protein [Agromyces lapidis]|uniref:CopG family transcriptional regulator n=1 Tax=Agromyces lapidis TaxID=279574 RepID=A0ABV5SSW1_9MICO|nr:hypothetical protein [Agromyces lapidis]
MPDVSIRVDADTHRALTDLAYLLGTTKKAVVADALADFTETHGAVVRAPGRVTFDELPVLDRLALRRRALLRAFAKRDATEVRVMRRDESDPDAPLELLVTTDLGRGGGEADELARIARGLLREFVRVESATRLELFDRPALERARACSTPL